MTRINFRNFTIPVTEEIILIYLVFIGLLYYVLFAKHHKKNKLTFSEIYPLIINYLCVAIISTFVFLFGMDCVLTGYIYNDEISEVVKELFLGLTAISIVILNFIFYVKKHRVDFIESERKENEKRDNYIGEWVQILIFSLMILIPLFNIFKYINFIDKAQKYRQIFGSVLCIVSSIYLLYNLNPLDIKGKIKKIIYKINKK